MREGNARISNILPLVFNGTQKLHPLVFCCRSHTRARVSEKQKYKNALVVQHLSSSRYVLVERTGGGRNVIDGRTLAQVNSKRASKSRNIRNTSLRSSAQTPPSGCRTPRTYALVSSCTDTLRRKPVRTRFAVVDRACQTQRGHGRKR